MDATHAHTKRVQICATETPREWWGRILAFHEPNEPQPLRDEYDTIIKPFLLQAISAGHGVVSTSGCAGPVSQPLVTGTYQSVAHLDQVLSMLMCLVVVGLGPSLSFGFFFLPLLWTSFSCPKKNSVGSLISRSFMRLMSPSVCLSMYHARTFFCKIMRVFGKSSDLSRVSAPC